MAEGQQLLARKGLIARKVGAAGFHQRPGRGVVGDLVYAVGVRPGGQQIHEADQQGHDRGAGGIAARCAVTCVGGVEP